MLRKFASLAAAIFAACTSSIVEASETIDWKKVGEWDVRIDPSVNNGCFIMGSYTLGETLRFGFDRENKGGYVLFGSAQWKSLVPGNHYPISMQFDSEVPWTGNALAVDMGDGLKALELTFSDSEILKEISSKQFLVIKYNNTVVSTLPLTGTGAAVSELISCQNYADRLTSSAPPSTTTPSDPFANTPATGASDPFAH